MLNTHPQSETRLELFVKAVGHHALIGAIRTGADIIPLVQRIWPPSGSLDLMLHNVLWRQLHNMGYEQSYTPPYLTTFRPMIGNYSTGNSHTTCIQVQLQYTAFLLWVLPDKHCQYQLPISQDCSVYLGI